MITSIRIFSATNTSSFFGLDACLRAFGVPIFIVSTNCLLFSRMDFLIVSLLGNSITRANTVLTHPNTAFLTSRSGDPDGDGFLKD